MNAAGRRRSLRAGPGFVRACFCRMRSPASAEMVGLPRAVRLPLPWALWAASAAHHRDAGSHRGHVARQALGTCGEHEGHAGVRIHGPGEGMPPKQAVEHPEAIGGAGPAEFSTCAADSHKPSACSRAWGCGRPCGRKRVSFWQYMHRKERPLGYGCLLAGPHALQQALRTRNLR